MYRSDDGVVDHLLAVGLTKLLKILAGELKPAGKGVAADHRCAQWLLFHVRRLNQRLAGTSSAALGQASVCAKIFVELGQAACVLIVGGLEQFGSAFAANDRPGGEHLGRMSGLGQAIGHLGLDGIDKNAAADGGAGGDWCVHSFDGSHRIAHWSAGVEHEIGEVLEFFAGLMPTSAGLGVLAADDGDNANAALLKRLCDLDGDDVATAGGNDEGGVGLGEVVVAQDALGQAVGVLEKHRLPLAIGTDDLVVKRERQLDDRVEAGERPVAGPHFLDHDPAVPGAKQVNHAPGEDAPGKPLGGLLDGIDLGIDRFGQPPAFFDVILTG